MPSSAIRTFTDPDDYAAAIRATRAELTVMGRGDFAAKLIHIDLHLLWMQRFSDNLPQVSRTAVQTGRAVISFPHGTRAERRQSRCGIAAHRHHAIQRGSGLLSAFVRVCLLGRHVAAGGGHGFPRDGDRRV
jgi:hypothetical protein